MVRQCRLVTFAQQHRHFEFHGYTVAATWGWGRGCRGMVRHRIGLVPSTRPLEHWFKNQQCLYQFKDKNSIGEDLFERISMVAFQKHCADVQQFFSALLSVSSRQFIALSFVGPRVHGGLPIHPIFSLQEFLHQFLRHFLRRFSRRFPRRFRCVFSPVPQDWSRSTVPFSTHGVAPFFPPHESCPSWQIVVDFGHGSVDDVRPGQNIVVDHGQRRWFGQRSHACGAAVACNTENRRCV